MDGDENPDTDLDNQEIDQTDLYRLYLDAQLSGESNPIDLLIVVDQSGSMHNDYQGDDVTAKYQDMTKEGGMDAFRDEALRLVLNGTSNNTDLNEYEKNKQNGLIYQFLAANKENKVAVVGFQGAGYTNGSMKYGRQYRYEKTGDKLADVTSGKLQTDGRNGSVTINVSSGIADTNGYLEAYTILDWTNQAQRVDVQGIPFNATNYTAGFIQAQRELDDATVKNDGRQKVILFLSDGIPTCYIGEGSGWGGSYYYRGGTGNNTESGTDAATNTAFSDFLKANQGTIFHTISIRGNNNNLTEEEKKDAEAAETRLRNMAADGGGQCFSVKTTDDLRANIKKLMFSTVYSELSIQDVLSQYVDLYEKQPDFKVTRKDGDGVETVLYENGAVTDAGNGVVESLLYNGNTKTISVVFNKNYTPAPGTTHTVSYNVQTSRKAYQEYAQKGYQQVTGEKNTDYTGNVNSSSQPGFHSNAQATVTYKTDGAEKPVTAEYPHPVVQVATCKIAVQKTDIRDPERALSDAVFTLYRKAFPEETGETLEGLSGSYIKIAEQLITDTSGQFAVDNLIPGEYCFVETQAPNGYREPFDPGCLHPLPKDGRSRAD